jgi:predicted enzyme related to lactoylglutathione lyase
MFMLQGKQVAGLGPQMNTDMPPFWTVYVTVADADATLEAVTANGGTIVMGPMDVFDAGRMGVIQDPMGSYTSIWQALGTIGAQLVNEPGTFAWNELATTDLAAANRFYGAVFGWGLHPDGSGEHSSLYTVGSEMACGAHVAGEGEFPAWSVWFASADCDASVAKVEELGGSLIVPPNDMEFGRGAVVADPQGAVFGLGTMKQPAD